MWTHEVMQEPVDIQPTLEPFVFCIGIGLAPMARHPPPPGRVERFDWVRVNLLLGNCSGRFGMFRLRCLILRPFASAAMGL